MKLASQNKIAYFILIFFFLIIIVSMMFSGFNDNFRMGGPKTVASVDGTPITSQEFQMALSRQLEFFSQMFGGNITQRQIEELGIKDQVLNGLVQQKLILNAAKEIGLVISLEEVKTEIRALPYFQTNNRFDVNLYRNRLQANGYIPAQFEELVANDLKQKKFDSLFEHTIASEEMARDIVKFKNSKVTVHAVKISRQSLAPLISVSQDELQTYLADPENQKAVEAAYNENYSEYNRPAEVKASHILIQGDDEKTLERAKAIRARVTARNFAQIASKETDDPSGKDKGGEIGWIGPGKTVPEFEKVAFELSKGQISDPVKTEFGYHIIYVQDKKAPETRPLESVREEIARMQIQKSKTQDLDQLMKDQQDRLTQALERNDLQTVESLQQKTGGQFLKSAEINQLEQNIGTTNLDPQEADKIFAAAAGSVINLGNVGSIHLVKVVAKALTLPESVSAEALKAEVTTQNQTFSRRSREELIKHMNQKAKIVTKPNLI
jgi:peptidyl-prolyl cis-trans isomerase D